MLFSMLLSPSITSSCRFRWLVSVSNLIKWLCDVCLVSNTDKHLFNFLKFYSMLPPLSSSKSVEHWSFPHHCKPPLRVSRLTSCGCFDFRCHFYLFQAHDVTLSLQFEGWRIQLWLHKTGCRNTTPTLTTRRVGGHQHTAVKYHISHLRDSF